MIKGFSHPIMLDRKKRSSIIISGDKLLSDYLRILLLSEPTETDADPFYGCKLKSLLFNPNDSVLVDMLKINLSSSIRTYASSIVVTPEDIDITQDEEKVTIKVRYTYSDRSSTGLLTLQILNSEVMNV